MEVSLRCAQTLAVFQHHITVVVVGLYWHTAAVLRIQKAWNEWFELLSTLGQEARIHMSSFMRE